ncbi:MAG: hypothetical protein HKO07_06270, partial [Pseudomonadales bacterium]|nr:hypothetical protein [Pseudomonadales bacterium]
MPANELAEELEQEGVIILRNLGKRIQRKRSAEQVAVRVAWWIKKDQQQNQTQGHELHPQVETQIVRLLP